MANLLIVQIHCIFLLLFMTSSVFLRSVLSYIFLFSSRISISTCFYLFLVSISLVKYPFFLILFNIFIIVILKYLSDHSNSWAICRYVPVFFLITSNIFLLLCTCTFKIVLQELCVEEQWRMEHHFFLSLVSAPVLQALSSVVIPFYRG